MRRFTTSVFAALVLSVGLSAASIQVASSGTSALTITIGPNTFLEDVRGTAALAVNGGAVNALIVDSLTSTPPAVPNNALIGIGGTAGEALALLFNFTGQTLLAAGVVVPVTTAPLGATLTDPALLGLSQAQTFGFSLVNVGAPDQAGNVTYTYTLSSIQAASVPEPRTLALIGLPGLGLIFARRRLRA